MCGLGVPPKKGVAQIALPVCTWASEKCSFFSSDAGVSVGGAIEVRHKIYRLCSLHLCVHPIFLASPSSPSSFFCGSPEHHHHYHTHCTALPIALLWITCASSSLSSHTHIHTHCTALSIAFLWITCASSSSSSSSYTALRCQLRGF